MKVTTDAVILGAWVDCKNNLRILDIGSGTGLLSLMLAQRNENACIDAIEIEQNAFEQAKQNFINSKWSQRLNIKNVSLQEYTYKCNKRYDFIISNPPFFISAQISDDIKKNLARHQVKLSFKDLLAGIEKLLTKEGKAYILIPFNQKSELIKEANEVRLYCTEVLNIKPMADKIFNRAIVKFERKEMGRIISELIIFSKKDYYTDDFIKLIRDFYIKY